MSSCDFYETVNFLCRQFFLQKNVISVTYKGVGLA